MSDTIDRTTDVHGATALGIDEQTVLVTGAGRGVGAHVAAAFARQGARVVVNYRRSDAAAAALAYRIGNDRAVAIGADVTDPDQVHDMFDRTKEHFGVPVTTVVNNALGDRRVDDATLHVRVFVPLAGIPEDPGTGSMAGPIAVFARHHLGTDVDVLVRQGDEIGRPCRIEAHAEEGAITIGGSVTACAEGRFVLDT